MAKKVQSKHSESTNNTQNTALTTRWENSLPSTYKAIVDGFDASMTVSELVSFLKLDEMREDLGQPPVDIPEEIRDIAIGCFTPNMFSHERYSAFWKTPVTTHHLYDFPSVFHALNDPDIQTLQTAVALENKDDFKIDYVRPDLETLARVAQMQYLGYSLRMSELTNNSTMARINSLREPAHYNELRKIAQHYRFELPVKPPEFTISQPEFSVKRIGSALSKAHYRTGKPKTIEDFLENPNKYGTNGVNDMKRTTIELPQDKKNQLHNYMNTRNMFAVAALSGYMGSVCTELSDQVLYPSSDRPSDQNPIMMIKYHAYDACPVIAGKHFMTALESELQIALMPEKARDVTHNLYKQSRREGITKEEQDAFDAARIMIFDSYKCDEIKQINKKHLAERKKNDPKLAETVDEQNDVKAEPEINDIVIDDPVGKWIQAVSNGLNMTNHKTQVMRNIVRHVYNDTPKDIRGDISLENFSANLITLTLNNRHNDHSVREPITKALSIIIDHTNQQQPQQRAQQIKARSRALAVT